jgi:hypothetical protein
MTRASEEADVSETQPSADEQSGASPSSTTINLNILRQPQGIGVGTAVALTAGASLATLVFVRRRRARARMRRLAWLAIRAALMRTILPRAARGAATFGGLGGLVLAAAMLQGRVRHSHSRRSVDELTERVTALQAQVDARGLSGRPRPRDVVIGAVLGLGLAGLVAWRRLSSRRQASRD